MELEFNVSRLIASVRGVFGYRIQTVIILSIYQRCFDNRRMKILPKNTNWFNSIELNFRKNEHMRDFNIIL